MRSSASSKDSDSSIRFIKLPVGVLRSVFPDLPPKSGPGRGGELTAAVRRVFLDLTNFFGVPAPMRRLLEEDRASQGIASNLQYVQWLTLQRAAELERRAKAEEA
ncbi:MAG: hypothetical protein SFW67_36950 [Myxococcaceae bacterium]|nr:hypothetical protein [Myxococcaceae bacterium]